ncbi:hypothetical protein OH77DRAFT_1419794 [Trametes cingulata]|nr:hypothetical protein OH77DRAFT_1419794 [Trametes cingulata]
MYYSVHPWNHTGVVRTFLKRVEAVSDKLANWTACAPPRNWRTREKDAISASRQLVDAYLVAKAYDASLADPTILDAAAKWLSDAKGQTVLSAFDRLRAVATKHFRSSPYQQVIGLAKSSAPILWWNTLLCEVFAVSRQDSCQLSESALNELSEYLESKGMEWHGQAPTDVLALGWSSNVFAAVWMQNGSSDRREDPRSTRDALRAIFNQYDFLVTMSDIDYIKEEIRSWHAHFVAVCECGTPS